MTSQSTPSPSELPAHIAQLQHRIRVALGQEPGDLLLRGGRVVNVFTQSVEPADVVIADGAIAGVGHFEWSAAETLDVSGQFLLPGLIDAHMHVESTLLLPAELGRLIVPHGTSTIVADPHEVANVLGTAGVELLLRASEGLPLDVLFMAPSCVPASQWESAGAELDHRDVAALLAHPRVLGLAELMDFPGVLAGREGVLAKIAAAVSRGAAVDGHAPALTTQQLNAYAAAGIRSDHESTGIDEALAKGALGMMVQVRDGSAARNLDTLLPLLVDDKLGDWCLCTDDIYPGDLEHDGHITGLLRRVVAAGVPAARAVRHATLVPARHYGLHNRGAVAPGYRADVVVVDDLDEFQVRLVLHGGELVARDGAYLPTEAAPEVPVSNTIHLGALCAEQLVPRISGPTTPVMEVVPNQILTRRLTMPLAATDGRWQYVPGDDLAALACIERHRASGRVGTCLVRGFALDRRGALASSVAHDAHNIVVVGTQADDMLAAVRRIEQLGGGWVVVANGKVLAELPLPVAGLLATVPAAEVIKEQAAVTRAAGELGCRLPNPFGTLSFVALTVIPELRITDRGLFDVTQGRLET